MSETTSPHPNKPGGSRFQQQTLPAWKPVYSAKCVIPLFFAFGVIFIPLGVIFLLESNTVKEVIIDYSNCTNSGGVQCSVFRENRTLAAMQQPCMCSVAFELTEDWTGPVFVYYRLTEFYQNHRRYLKSVNQEQLLGSLGSDSGCIPNAFQRSEGQVIVPCGMIANSKFNDTFMVTGVGWNRTGIAWSEDIKYKFANPPNMASFNDTAAPIYWQQPVQDLPGALQNEDLAVWMRTAALPRFRKLYARIQPGLPRGSYTLSVDFRFPIKRGGKSIVLSTTGWLGGKNNFLGIAYLTVGGLSITGGCVLIAIYLLFGRTKKDLTKLQ